MRKIKIKFSDESIKFLLKSQRQELTQHYIYKRFIPRIDDFYNQRLLEMIANDELTHHNYLKRLTARDVKPNIFKIIWYIFMSYVFGISFILKLMERKEMYGRIRYKKFRYKVDEVGRIIKDEYWHEIKLLDILNEAKIRFLSSILTILNDAMAGITAILLGLTMVLMDSRLIAAVFLSIGFAVAISMISSDMLKRKKERFEKKTSLKMILLKGIFYIITIAFLIIPFLIIKNPLIALAVAVLLIVFVIDVFNFYISVVENKNFKRQFTETILLNLSVGTISLVIGFVIRRIFSINV
ncbi:MAG: rubrerythrin family protein [Candidatus Marinimicrobia bacterium]|nr:rubrerythrin family protein [Candidatus Neomarinimicrobiota bacterium]